MASTRASFITNQLHKQRTGVLMTGGSGTAKTSTALIFFDTVMETDNMRLKKVCFSSATTPSMIQTTLELELDKRGGKNFGPPNGKRMTVFIDDMSQPERNDWGDQPTLEFVRQLVETSGFCFLDKDKRGDMKVIEDLQFICAMGHPGGGRQDIPNRLKRHFFIFNLILPSIQVNSLPYSTLPKYMYLYLFSGLTFHQFDTTIHTGNQRDLRSDDARSFHQCVSGHSTCGRRYARRYRTAMELDAHPHVTFSHQIPLYLQSSRPISRLSRGIENTPSKCEKFEASVVVVAS